MGCGTLAQQHAKSRQGRRQARGGRGALLVLHAVWRASRCRLGSAAGVLLAVLWTGSMISASNIDRSSDIHHVARTYLLRMETDGYLTEENKALMLAELQALDVSGIDLTGTDFSDVGYGNPVRLVIKVW